MLLNFNSLGNLMRIRYEFFAVLARAQNSENPNPYTLKLNIYFRCMVSETPDVEYITFLIRV